MGKYAIITTDTGMFPGVNGMLNALKYYGNDVEFHYLWDGPKAEKFANEIVKDGFFKKFYPIRLRGLMEEGWPKHHKPGEIVWYTMFYRYVYAVRKLLDYDAVSVFDADMQITNNIMQFFEMADKTDLLFMPNNDYSGQEFDECQAKAIKGAASPPLHNMPCFFKPKYFVDVMEEIIPRNYEVEVGGDMTALSHALLKLDVMKKVVPTPNVLWVLSHYYNVRLHKRKIADKLYLTLHHKGDRVNSFHRKWWHDSVCRNFIHQVKEKENRVIAANNINIFWQFTMFFNFELYHTIEWDPKWGVPNKFVEVTLL